MATLGALTAQSIENHRRADAASVYGPTASAADGSGRRSERPVEVSAYSPPSCIGGDDADLPEFWNLVVDHLEGFAWPNADTDRLRAAAATWRDAAADVRLLPGHCDTAISMFSDQQSPEIPLAVDATGDLRQAVEELASALDDLAEACGDYAADVDQHREVVVGILRDLAIEAGISLAAGAIVGLFTFGGGAVAGTALATTRAFAAARSIITALRALRAAAKLKAVTKLTCAMGKLRPLRSVLARFKRRRSIDRAATATDEMLPLTVSQREALAYATSADKMSHVFELKHKLGDLATWAGGERALMERMVWSLDDVPSGVFEVQRMIGGQMVTIRGAVVGGIPKIGTAFIP